MADDRFSGKAREEYELFKLSCPHFEELEKTIGKAIKEHFKDIQKEEVRVIEIGCGPGYTTLIILDADQRTKITALDNEPVMISQAEQILKQGIDKNRVELVQSDALEFLKNKRENVPPKKHGNIPL